MTHVDYPVADYEPMAGVATPGAWVGVGTTDRVRTVCRECAIGLMYLPRHSPEFNPIEPAWAKMKERLKAKAARTLEALEAELKPALDTITAKDAKGWIRHAGYALH